MGGIVRSRPMLPDLARLSEDELIDLNRRVVERLPLLRSAKSLAQLPTLSAGMVVEFDPDDGRTLGGTIARLNQRTATAVTASGRGYVLQAFLAWVRRWRRACCWNSGPLNVSSPRTKRS
jgi:hypothetical protein